MYLGEKKGMERIRCIVLQTEHMKKYPKIETHSCLDVSDYGIHCLYCLSNAF